MSSNEFFIKKLIFIIKIATVFYFLYFFNTRFFKVPPYVSEIQRELDYTIKFTVMKSYKFAQLCWLNPGKFFTVSNVKNTSQRTGS